MPEASDLLRLSGSLWLWQAYDPAAKSDLFSTAIKTKAGLFFIDPIPLVASCLEQLSGGARVAGVLVTNLNHPRAAETFARQFNAPIFGASSVVDEFEEGAATTNCGRRQNRSGGFRDYYHRRGAGRDRVPFRG